MMSGQCLRIPSCTWAKSSGSELGLSSGLRTWMCTSAAPASYAAWVDSICSLTVTGNPGQSFLRGTDPVMATEMMAGVVMVYFLNGYEKQNGPRSYLCGPFMQVRLIYFFKLSWAPSLL